MWHMTTLLGLGINCKISKPWIPCSVIMMISPWNLCLVIKSPTLEKMMCHKSVFWNHICFLLFSFKLFVYSCDTFFPSNNNFKISINVNNAKSSKKIWHYFWLLGTCLEAWWCSVHKYCNIAWYLKCRNLMKVIFILLKWKEYCQKNVKMVKLLWYILMDWWKHTCYKSFFQHQIPILWWIQ